MAGSKFHGSMAIIPCIVCTVKFRPPARLDHRPRSVAESQARIISRVATTSTTASKHRNQDADGRRLPKREPKSPPETAASAHHGSSGGRLTIFETAPRMPATELTRMNAADTLEVSRVSTQWQISSGGLRTIAPPVPVRTESRPMIAPATSAAHGGGACHGSLNLRHEVTSIRAATNSSTQPTVVLYPRPGGVIARPRDAHGIDATANGQSSFQWKQPAR